MRMSAGESRRTKNNPFILIFKSLLIFRFIFYHASRIVIGNDTGPLNNLFSIIKHCYFKLTTPNPKNNECTDTLISMKKKLKNDGFVFLEKLERYNTNLLLSIKEKVNEQFSLINNKNVILTPSQLAIEHPEQIIPEIMQLITPNVMQFLVEYYGSSFRIKDLAVWRNMPIQQQVCKDVLSSNWHNDREDATSLRLFVLLSDNVNSRTGATRAFTKKYTKKIMRSGTYIHRFKYFGKAKKLISSTDNIQYFNGNLGDAYFVNTQVCLHCASEPEKGCFRDIIQFYIVPSNELQTNTSLAQFKSRKRRIHTNPLILNQ